MDKHQVLKHLTRARAILQSAVEGLAYLEITTQPVSGAWTIREILAHIGGWATWDLNTIKAIQQGERPDLSVIQDVDTFNQRLVAERYDRSLDQILAEMQDTHAAIQELVAGMPDRDLLEARRFRGPYWDCLAEWLQVAWEHEEDHAVQIQTWRENRF